MTTAYCASAPKHAATVTLAFCLPFAFFFPLNMCQIPGLWQGLNVTAVIVGEDETQI